MELISAHVENFGRLSGLDLRFRSGLNLFLRDNGWGKSTFAAFIRVMFYGFGNEKKRNPIENERRKYAPWQGGIYGGEIVFSLKGRRYRVQRTFGAQREKEDTFALYDADTNLPSSDYSERLGEEIFAVDRDSYSKTVFVGQQDCATAATPGINAKIGNVADAEADMGSYGDVMKRLKSEADRLTPDRKTGAVRKLTDRIAYLEAEAEKGEAQLRTVRNEQMNREEHSPMAEGDIQELHRLTAVFEEGMPDEAEFGRLEKLSSELEELREKLDDAGLSDRERREFEENRELFASFLPEDEEITERIRDWEARKRLQEILPVRKAALRDLLDELDEEKNDRDDEEFDVPRGAGHGSRLTAVLFALVGSAVLAFAAFRFVKEGPGTIPLITVIAGCMFLGIALVLAGKRGGTSEDEDAGPEARRRKRTGTERAERDGTSERIAVLREEIESDRHQIAELGRGVQELLDDLRIDPEGNVTETLYELRSRARSFRAMRERSDQERFLTMKKAALEKEEKLRQRLESYYPDPADRTDPVETVRMLRRDAKSYRSLCRMERIAKEAHLAAKREALAREAAEADRIDELRAEIGKCKGEREKLLHRYQVVVRTAAFLERAKAQFSARYMGPVKAAFDSYVSMIAPDDERLYTLDADLEITVREWGQQRQTESQSDGYRDLIGLCRRLAMIDVMYEKAGPFLIMDDPFVNLDDEKLAGASVFLRRIAEKYQVLYFSCSRDRCL
ncbi:MAG: AAA family ATPase [Eubacterium sp.]|nr:AAA family ATPase [Eubacterium sp.]